jgi:HD-like signal output (HDOD) protein
MAISPEQLAQEVETLFSLPDVAIRLNDLIDQPGTSIRDLVEVVQLDAGISATVLRLANSAWYAAPAGVDTVSRAVNLIGQKALRDLVMSTSVITTFKGISAEFVDMRDFWDNSVTCGVVTRNLAQKCGIRDAERMFLAGLMHKIGRLVFYVSRPVEYRQVVQTEYNNEVSSEVSIVQAEEAVFGFSYAQLGAALLRAWRMPAALDEVVEYQLHPLQAPNKKVEAAIIHVAGNISYHMAPDIKARFHRGEYQLTFQEDAWASLAQERSILAEIMQNSLIQSFDLLEVINPHTPTFV